jgi:sugar lactone lactonase YvrE
MIRTVMALAAFALAPAALAQETLQTLGQKARAAREAKDYPAYLSAVEQMRAMLPWSPSMQYNMARAYALNGRSAEALAQLTALADAGWGFDAAGDAVLAVPLKDAPGFAAVVERLAVNSRPQGQAIAGRKLGLAGKQPEGVAATADGTLYVGALREGIHRVDGNGLTRLYAPPSGWGIVGLRIDTPRRELIACLSNEEAGAGRLVRLALPDLTERASADLKAAGAFCNDSTVLPDGRVALTDSTGGRLWIATRTEATHVKQARPLIYPNGIAFSEGRLYVADQAGLSIIDPATGASREVKAERTSLTGIDGLIAHQGKLLAVQNGTQPVRILRITPKPDDTAEVQVLAAGHPFLAGATTAAVRGDRLLVLTQTGIPNGSLPDDPMLVEVPLGR